MAYKLFVGGLSFSTTSERLRELFAQVGHVESAAVVTDQTGRSRGFGFVEMSTNEEAEQAVTKFNDQDVDWRRLKVERAKSPGAGAGGGQRPRSDRGGAGRGRW